MRFFIFSILVVNLLLLSSGCSALVENNGTGHPQSTNASQFPEPLKRHPAEPNLPNRPESVGNVINIALSDQSVQDYLSNKKYGEGYIISDVISGTTALNEGILHPEDLPHSLAAIVVISLLKPNQQEVEVLVVVDVTNEKVTSFITRSKD